MKPTLHCSIGHFPRLPSIDKGPVERFPGFDGRFQQTRLTDMNWATHTFRELFMPPTLDMMKPVEGEDIFDYIERFNVLEDRVRVHARIILGSVAGFYGRVTDHLQRIFVDLEAATLGGREPYTDPEYGQRCIQMMVWLCQAIESEAALQGWMVLAAPYRPLRPTGLVSARPSRVADPMPDSFVDKWGGKAMAPLLSMELLWVHLYCPPNPADMRGATHEDFAYRQVKWAAEQADEAGAAPEEIWMVSWPFSELRADTMLGLFAGTKRGLDEFWKDRPAVPHFSVCCDWGILHGLVDMQVEKISKRGEPNKWNIEPDLACEALVTAWNRDVVGPYTQVFGQVTA